MLRFEQPVRQSSTSSPTLGSSFTLLIFLLSTGGSCGPIGQHFFSGVTIDRDLHLSPNGNEIGSEPASGQYYSIFFGANINSVDHFERHAAKDRERLLSLEMNTQNAILLTEKHDKVLEGSFGTVYVTKECRFEEPEKIYVSSVSVGGAQGGYGEMPSSLSSWPKDAPPLTSFSLVRIFRLGPKHLIVAANYEADGQLYSLHLFGAENGNWLLPHEGRSHWRDHTTYERANSYGIPQSIDLSKYVHMRSLALPKVLFEQEKSFVVEVHGFDKLIRLDELRGGAVASSSYLRPSTTEEEKLLNPVCEERFDRQVSLGLSTVQ